MIVILDGPLIGEVESGRAQMSTRLANRLASVRRRAFVGRKGEIELFQGALKAPDWEFCVIHFSGPGGIGKSTLLSELRRLALDEGAIAVLLDAINIAPSPEGFLDALRL